MDIDLFQSLALGHLQKGKEVVQMGVDATVGQKAHQVQGSTLFQAGVHGVIVGGILKERAVTDGLGDAGQILEHHTARADVGVAHLAVAHLPVRQAHIQAGGPEGGMGIFLEELIQAGSAGGADSIADNAVGEAKAIHNDEGSGCFIHRNLVSRIIDSPL